MKKFKKIFFIIFIIVIILGIFFLFNSNKSKPITNNTSSKNNNISTTNETNRYQSNFRGENAVIYLGTHSQYEPMTVVLEMPDSKEKFIENVILKISSIIGYTIKTNSVKLDGTNIYIDFSKEYAPFNIENSKLETDEALYSLYGTENIIYTIFDSIAKTLISYFGAEYNVYFSANSENINITYNDFSFKVDSTVPYVINE